ncbi:hypothetical protein DPEC_G00256870 [Dallia pectoralis]|uniref:Uncharacterized protein n=1 Tax=Dallia pectoralis TaxID=75939 RepID=A0ACC2FQQ6_DALPE|nr:hypothetical protein DPEC_G00256870 [Dallia pectoralis]
MMMVSPRGRSDRVADSVLLVVLLVTTTALGAVFAKDTAFVEVVLFESSPNGDYTTYTTGLQGRFSRAGATNSAEGEIVQGLQPSPRRCKQGEQPARAGMAGLRSVPRLFEWALGRLALPLIYSGLPDFSRQSFGREDGGLGTVPEQRGVGTSTTRFSPPLSEVNSRLSSARGHGGGVGWLSCARRGQK